MVFLVVKETIVGSLLCCGVVIVQCLFQPFVFFSSFRRFCCSKLGVFSVRTFALV